MAIDPDIKFSYLRPAARVLIRIANAYLSNDLDDEARRFWGKDLEHENSRDPKDIVLVSGRGGKPLLTLQDCLDAKLACDALGITP